MLWHVLTKRDDFLRAARATALHTPAFVIQARPNGLEGMRVGFTCSKKVGNAVARNRAKRRLRATVQQVVPHHGQLGWDYVLIGRKAITATHPFLQMQADLIRALGRFHA